MYIYSISIDGEEKYIGLTRQGVRRRWCEHKHEASPSGFFVLSKEQFIELYFGNKSLKYYANKFGCSTCTVRNAKNLRTLKYREFLEEHLSG